MRSSSLALISTIVPLIFMPIFHSRPPIDLISSPFLPIFLALPHFTPDPLPSTPSFSQFRNQVGHLPSSSLTSPHSLLLLSLSALSHSLPSPPDRSHPSSPLRESDGTCRGGQTTSLIDNYDDPSRDYRTPLTTRRAYSNRRPSIWYSTSCSISRRCALEETVWSWVSLFFLEY